MAKLPDANRVAVWAQAMAQLSSARVETPVTKPQFRYLVNTIDDQLETFEAAVVSGLPAGDAKTWLLANVPIARRLVVMIAEARRLVL